MADPADTDVLEKPKADDTTPVAKPDEIKPPADVTAPPRLLTPERIIQRFDAAADEALRTSGEAQTKIAESAGREADILRHKIETQAPARKEVEQSIDEELRVRRENRPQPPAELPERPKLRYDLHEIMGPPGSNKPMNEWMNQIGVLAAISGRTPQERMLLAVTAFNGMIEGWAKGKQEDFQQRYNEWKDQVETIRDTETRKRQYIQDVLNDSKATTELKSLKLQVLGQEDGDRLLVEAAIQKQWGAIDKGNEEKFTRFERMFKTAGSIVKTLQKQQVDALMDNPGIVAAANRFAHGFDATPGAGYRAGTPEREAVASLAAQIMQREGISDTDRLHMYQQNVVAGAAGARTGATMDVRITSAANEVARLIPLADNSAREVSKVADFNWTLLNRLRNAFLEGRSDPRYYSFLVNNESLLRAWGRAMNPTGQPRVSEINNARLENVLSRVTNFESYEAMLHQLWNEVQATKEAVEDTRAGRAPPNPWESAPATPGAPTTAPKTYPGVRSIEEVH